MLTTDDSKKPALNADRYLDHRTEDNSGDRDARIAKNVGQAIRHLNCNDDSHRATYDAILGRGRQQEEASALVGEEEVGDNHMPSPSASYNRIEDENTQRDRLL